MEQKLWGWRTRIWLALNCLDIVTTLAASYTYLGFGVPWSSAASFSLAHFEVNPFIRLLALSPQAFVAYKVLGSLLVLDILILSKRPSALRVLNYLMAGVVVWNTVNIIFGMR